MQYLTFLDHPVLLVVPILYDMMSRELQFSFFFDRMMRYICYDIIHI